MNEISGSDAMVQAARTNARGARGWLKFLGILSIIGGVSYVLTVVGIISGAIMIWVGVLLLQSGGQAALYAERGDAASLAGYTGKLKSMFAIWGILAIISIALAVIGTIVMLILIGVGMFSLDQIPNLFEQFGY
ncbi:MAG TPA: hypothetical protein ENN51_04945 [candidate division WOR-3 bacterium]|uniref:DUF5362 domain-containing protein n=1 Tax=candidate division WOR-3 bacterium TaxID=2052148 RepID=A0A7V0T6A2_UNCW3|nr:hypothetical protein [candidate division WOR-3 bacterium]